MIVRPRLDREDVQSKLNLAHRATAPSTRCSAAMFEVRACIESGGLKALALTNPTVAMGEQHARQDGRSIAVRRSGL
jgi:hypothetical protein